MTQRYAIGIDLGGTSVKYALVSENGNILTHGKHPSLATESGEAVIGQILKGVKEAKTYADTQGYNVTGIGVGTPGIIDDTYRIVLGGAENIKGWEGIHLADLLEAQTGLPTRIGNDASIAGLGETLYGAGQGCSNTLFITVGTGIGDAIIIGGKLFDGYANRGGELGHVPLFADGRPCPCGARGCLEAYASTSALVRMFKEECQRQGKDLNGTEPDGVLIVKLYKEGDAIAHRCMEKHFDYLGHGIGGFINIFSPQKVIIGGGLSEAGPFYIEELRKSAYRYAMPACAEHTEIVAAQLGNRAGCIGAASLIFKH